MSRATGIAVVVPCYELGRWLEEAVDSVLLQTRPADEIVVVDDGSRDHVTCAVLDRLRRPRTRVIRAPHRGVALARNLGAAETHAPYLLFLDADDVLGPRWLERAAGKLDASPQLDFVSCAVEAFGGASYRWKPPAVDAIGTLTSGSAHISSLMRREVWSRLHGFDPELAVYEDLDFWLRAIESGSMSEVLDEVHLHYRVREHSRYRAGLEPAVYRAAFERIILKHPRLLEERPLEVLKAKERFIAQVLDHGDALRARKATLEQELASLREVIARKRPGRAAQAAAAALAPVDATPFFPSTAPGPGPHEGLILAWHRIATLSPDTHGLCEPPDQFRQQLDWLRDNCTVLPLTELVERAQAGTLPARAVALTLDDGYLDALQAATPRLVEVGLPATFFVNTERLDEPHEGWQDVLEHVHLGPVPWRARLEVNVTGVRLSLDTGSPAARQQALIQLHRALLKASSATRDAVVAMVMQASGVSLPARDDHRLLTLNEVRQLSRFPGISIGSHSAHHLWLPSHDAQTRESEVRGARERLERAIDAPVPTFCYPYGAYDPAVVATVAQAGHRFAVTTDEGLVTHATDPLRLPRVEVRNLGLTAFAERVDGLFRSVQETSQPDAWSRNYWRSSRELGQGRSSLASLPQFLIIDPTSRCNARCVMCPVSFRQPGDRGVDLSRALVDKIRPVLPVASHVNLFASGEPTIAPDIEALVETAARETNPRAQVWLSTNGKEVSQALIDLLVSRGVGIQFSVDGGTPAVFEAIRRGIKFEQLTRSLELVRARRGEARTPPLSFSCTVSKRNLHDLANIFELAAEYRVDQVLFYEEDPENDEQLQFVLDESDRPAFEAQRARIDATGISYRNGLFFQGPPDHRPQPPKDPTTGPLRCVAPWKVMMLRADGEVRTCCTLRESMGNLAHASFDEVWNGPQYAQLRKAFVEQKRIPSACHNCADPLRTFGE
jgi:MoaA/NifB/PqqE/SkfB family radical SAM enzyme/peptidoglycan/xylan/chitin deacetylase (PgdA/CDA1 family)/GT2 family glycosyltransferase